MREITSNELFAGNTKELVMNKETGLELFLGTLSVDDGVKVSSSGIYDCVNNEDGSVQWRDTLYFEGDRPFNLFKKSSAFRQGLSS